MRTWMAKASADDKHRLASLAGTSVGTLYQIAGGYRDPDQLPRISAELAGRLETASRAAEFNGLPVLRRDKLCPACAKCPYAAQCPDDKESSDA